MAPTGAKSFAFLYQDAAGVNKTHTLGAFGKLTLAQAIAGFETATKLLADSKCPRAAQLAARERKRATLQTVFADWFPNYAKTVHPKYAKRTSQVMASREMAELRGELLAALDTPTVKKFCSRMEVVRSKGFAREALHLVDKLFKHAIVEGLHTGNNPAQGVAEKLTPRDSQPWEALQLEQVRAYFADLDALQGKVQGSAWRVQRPRKQVQAQTLLALYILPYITVRPSVLRFAEWKWVSWDGPQGAMLTVPAFVTGTKQRANTQRADGKGKNYAPYRVPLSRQVVSLLRQLHAITGANGGRFLFPGSKSKKVADERPISEGRWLATLRRLGWDGTTELRGKITCHGFRAMFATSAYQRYVITRMEEHALEFQQDHKLTEGVRAHYTKDKQGSHRGLLLGALFVFRGGR